MTRSDTCLAAGAAIEVNIERVLLTWSRRRGRQQFRMVLRLHWYHTVRFAVCRFLNSRQFLLFAEQPCEQSNRRFQTGRRSNID